MSGRGTGQSAGERPLTLQEHQKIKGALPMVRGEAQWVSQRCWRWVQVQVEDLLGPGTIAAAEALRSYRPERRVEFEHYARSHVRGRMLDAVRTEHLPLWVRVEHAMDREEAATSEHLVINVDLSIDPEEVLEWGMKRACDDMMTAVLAAGLLEALAPSPEDQAIELEEYRHALDVFGDALKALPPLQRDVFLRVHRDREDLEAISVELGVHYNTIRNRLRGAIQTLRTLMTKCGIEECPRFVDNSLEAWFRNASRSEDKD